jgi:hypothetical protein
VRLEGIEIGGSQGIYNYIGMIQRSSGLPFGYGRAVRTNGSGFIDG